MSDDEKPKCVFSARVIAVSDGKTKTLAEWVAVGERR